ncbi:alkene reductase [Halospina sp. K52047b]|uniref:alkene reductase n=1 Tax=Halospina sp. K52047b TaxID=2614160 RepID=UPI00124A4168|nr:alkene reductase [Halospina sp. K52047b]KAA8982881.1 alkene reductase [Halospina sp. K52047b]
MTNGDNVLFEPFTLGDLELPNRIIMAPLTRARASQPGDVPSDMNARYYAQRASAGLIFSEATQVSQQGQGYAYTPGIYTPEQIAGWRKVTDAVHAAGGRMHAQLWHVGRISHPELQPNGELPVAPSAIKPEGSQVFISADSGMVDIPTPRALEADELPGIVEQYRQGAENAREAGFDGIEIHAANGYLLDQFIKSGSNHRTDDYGGSVENRLRFPMMVVEAVKQVWPAARIGIRVSPTGSFNSMFDADPHSTFRTLARKVQEAGLAYIEVVEDSFQGNHENGRPESVIDAIREEFTGAYIGNGAYSRNEAIERINAGRCDLASFGRPIIANPDLVERFRQDAPLNEWDASTFYGGDERGYTDYPTLAESQ